MRPDGGPSENGHAEPEASPSASAWVKRRAGDEPEDADDYVAWRQRDLSVRQPRGRQWMVRLLAYATAVTAFVVLLMEVQRDPDRCHPNCFDGSDNTFESGHVWTAYFGAWQWEVQLLLGWLGFLVSLGALYVAGRRSRGWTIASLGASVALIAVWIVWVTVQPSPLERA
jgi:hypothetical protein